MRKRIITILTGAICILFLAGTAMAGDACIDCHSNISPGQVKDWQASKHAEMGVTCESCHGDAHSNAADYKKAVLPSEQVCAECHEEQFTSFSHGKHNFGWTVLNAIPGTPPYRSIPMAPIDQYCSAWACRPIQVASSSLSTAVSQR